MVLKRYKKAASYCDLHDKWLYATRTAAKSVARQHKDGHMNVYRCSRVPTMFHVGHLAKPVIEGEATRGDIYPEEVA